MRDILDLANQMLAQCANEVWITVAGISFPSKKKYTGAIKLIPGISVCFKF
jgi:hypothetical protein